MKLDQGFMQQKSPRHWCSFTKMASSTGTRLNRTAGRKQVWPACNHILATRLGWSIVPLYFRACWDMSRCCFLLASHSECLCLNSTGSCKEWWCQTFILVHLELLQNVKAESDLLLTCQQSGTIPLLSFSVHYRLLKGLSFPTAPNPPPRSPKIRCAIYFVYLSCPLVGWIGITVTGS